LFRKKTTQSTNHSQILTVNLAINRSAEEATPVASENAEHEKAAPNNRGGKFEA